MERFARTPALTRTRWLPTCPIGCHPAHWKTLAALDGLQNPGGGRSKDEVRYTKGMSASLAYEEVIDFIAESNPARVIAFRPSDAARERVADLLARNNAGTLSPAETSELDHYCQLEHIMRMAK